MLHNFSRRTALLLLPIIVQAFVIPNDVVVDVESNSGSQRYIFDSPAYGGPSTYFEYDNQAKAIKFSIPCPDCSDEEKELLNQEIISIKATAQNTQHCTSTDPIGLEINDQEVISTGESSLTLQSHVGPFHLTKTSKHSIFNRTRWINHCGCTKKHLDDEECHEDFESSFSLEILGLSSGRIPGFTISYRQNGIPEILRFSTFPDIGIADSWRFGQSSHYNSPLLRLQKVIHPTSTAISTSSFFSPSSTASASSPSYTFLEKTPKKLEQSDSPSSPIPSEVGLSSQPLTKDGETRDSLSTGLSDHHDTRWCHIPDVLVAVGHELEVLSVKAKSRAQTVLGKFSSPKPAMASLNKHQEVLHKLSDNTDYAHDELDDVVVVVNEPENDKTITDDVTTGDFFNTDLPSDPWFFDNPTTIKAFQVTSVVFIIAALSGSLFALCRRNPRLRAKWASILEEHRNQRLYRHAARRQQCQKFFSKFRSSCPEKNKLVGLTHEEDVLGWQEWDRKHSTLPPRYDENINSQTLKRDLLAFRKAHQFVDGIIAAEEGLPSHSRRTNNFTYRGRHQRTWSFGSEKTAPPAYESEGEDVILDADMPRFVAIRRGMAAANISPDSSVVSTSPRSSCVDSDSEHDEKF